MAIQIDPDVDAAKLRRIEPDLEPAVAALRAHRDLQREPVQRHRGHGRRSNAELGTWSGSWGRLGRLLYCVRDLACVRSIGLKLAWRRGMTLTWARIRSRCIRLRRCRAGFEGLDGDAAWFLIAVCRRSLRSNALVCGCR